ncbi:hypothetical protein ABPG72_006801 [Tetrahymena utriculariae]
MISLNKQSLNYETDCNEQNGSPNLQSEQYKLKQTSNRIHADTTQNQQLNIGFIPNAVEIFSNLRIIGAKNIQIPPAPKDYFDGYDDSSARAVRLTSYEIDLVKASMKQIQQEQNLNLDGLIYEQHTNMLDSNFIQSIQEQICKYNTQFSSRQVASGQVIQSIKILNENLQVIYKESLFYFYLDLIPFFICFLIVTIVQANDSQIGFIPILAILIVMTCIKIYVYFKILFSLKKSNISGMPSGSQFFGILLQIISIPFSSITVSLLNNDMNNLSSCLALINIGGIFSLLIQFSLNYETDCNEQNGSPNLQSEQYNFKQVSNQIHAEIRQNKELNIGFIPNAVEIFCNLRITAAKNIQIPPAPKDYFEGCDDSSARAVKQTTYEIDLVKASMKQIQQEQNLNLDGLIYEQHTNMLDSNFLQYIQEQICKKNNQYSSRQIAAGQIIQSIKKLHQNLQDIYKSSQIYFYLDFISFFICYLTSTIILAYNSETGYIPLLVFLIVVTCIKIYMRIKLLLSLKKSNLSGMPGPSQFCVNFLQILAIPFSSLTISLFCEDFDNLSTVLPLTSIGGIFSLIISFINVNKMSILKSIMQRIGCLLLKYPDRFIQ